MLLPPVFYPHVDCLARHLPHLQPSQVRGLALWVGATILAHSGCQHAVLGTLLTLAIDPTAKGEALVALVVSVVCRGLAIPMAWHLKPGGQPGPWKPDLCALLDRLGSAVPVPMTMRVLCDRGLQSSDLWAAIRRQGWHPYMRYDRHMTFQATRCPRPPR